MFFDFVGLNTFVNSEIDGNTLQFKDVRHFYDLDNAGFITASTATALDSEIGSGRSATKTAIYFWIYQKPSDDGIIILFSILVI